MYLQKDSGSKINKKNNLLLKEITLPRSDNPNSTINNTYVGRRTFRVFDRKLVGLETFSSILEGALYESRILRDYVEKNKRSNPSVLLVSRFSQFEIYVAVNEVSNIPRGLYSYSIENHSLRIIEEDDFGEFCNEVAIGQGCLHDCGFTIFIAADYQSYMWKYRLSRALRSLYIEAGMLAYRFLIAAEA